MTVDYRAVLNLEYPDAKYAMDGDDYEGIVWLDESPQPTKAALTKKWPQVQHDIEVARIRAERHRRYLAETDQLFMKAQRDEEDGVTMADWKAAVAAIKAALPYPEMGA